MPTAAEAAATRDAIVPDASAMVAVLIDPGSDGAAVGRRLGGASSLLAPALLPFEVANVLRRRRNAGLLTETQAAAAHHDLLGFPITLWPWEALAERAWSLGPNLSSYDAASVSLAEQTGAVLLTRDRRLAAAPGVQCRVEVI